MATKIINMCFKHQEYIDKLSTQCPPQDYEPKEMLAFRFVFEPNDERSIGVADSRYELTFIGSYKTHPPRAYSNCEILYSYLYPATPIY